LFGPEYAVGTAKRITGADVPTVVYNKKKLACIHCDCTFIFNFPEQSKFSELFARIPYIFWFKINPPLYSNNKDTIKFGLLSVHLAQGVPSVTRSFELVEIGNWLKNYSCKAKNNIILLGDTNFYDRSELLHHKKVLSDSFTHSLFTKPKLILNWNTGMACTMTNRRETRPYDQVLLCENIFCRIKENSATVYKPFPFEIEVRNEQITHLSRFQTEATALHISLRDNFIANKEKKIERVYYGNEMYPLQSKST